MEGTSNISGPTIRRHRSKQDHATPLEFTHAVEDRFGPLSWDLAATAENKKAPMYISSETNSLTVPWHKSPCAGLLWLNPPFGHIEPWAAKTRWEADQGANILLLTPASVGALWFINHVHRHAMVFTLFPRIIFEGSKDPYPKDCILSVFWGGVTGFDVWKWK